MPLSSRRMKYLSKAFGTMIHVIKGSIWKLHELGDLGLDMKVTVPYYFVWHILFRISDQINAIDQKMYNF